MENSEKPRCGWANPGSKQAYYVNYHDTEWGVPSHDDPHLFELLILEGAQAGLTWDSVLKRRQAYKDAFYGFNPAKVANMTDAELENLLQPTAKIIRNRQKVFGTRQNAQVFIKIQQEYGSFSDYLWAYVGGKPRLNRPVSLANIPTQSLESAKLSKDLKKRGMTFVGPTIMYAYMQAVGLVNDHVQACFCCPK